MNGRKLIPTLVLAIITALSCAGIALAITPFPAATPDLPPGAMSYGNVSTGSSMDPNIVAAVIGVAGLLVGSIITILATYFMRWMDVRREDRREDLLADRDKREKEFQIKQEIYKNFLNELSELETFQHKDLDSFKRAWTKTEINIDLVASPKVRTAKDTVQNEMIAAAEQSFRTGAATLSPQYLQNRDTLLQAIREDIDIF
jgi:hypothetical protein